MLLTGSYISNKYFAQIGALLMLLLNAWEHKVVQNLLHYMKLVNIRFKLISQKKPQKSYKNTAEIDRTL